MEVVHTGTAKFDLTLNLDATGSGFLEYSADLFDHATARTLAERFTRLLSGAVADPDRPIGRLDVLGEGERRTLIEEWNGDLVSSPGTTLPDLFEARVRRTPYAIAVENLTYAELNARANRLAHKLIAHGARPESVVALSCPARPTWSSPCSRWSRRAPPTCRSTRPTRPTGCTTWSPTPDRSAWWTRPGWRTWTTGSTTTPSGRWSRATPPTSSTPPARPGGPRACWSRTTTWSG
nr:hypothetical protein GCM10020093_049960 [Planobispora longispora]